MHTHNIDFRIVLTSLAFVFALVIAAVTPLTAKADDGSAEFAMCRTGSFVLYLECVDANSDVTSGRGTASINRPLIVLGTVSDYLFMEQNAWGEDFDATRFNLPSYFPNPDDASLTLNGIPSY